MEEGDLMILAFDRTKRNPRVNWARRDWPNIFFLPAQTSISLIESLLKKKDFSYLTHHPRRKSKEKYGASQRRRMLCLFLDRAMHSICSQVLVEGMKGSRAWYAYTGKETTSAYIRGNDRWGNNAPCLPISSLSRFFHYEDGERKGRQCISHWSFRVVRVYSVDWGKVHSYFPAASFELSLLPFEIDIYRSREKRKYWIFRL